MKKIILALVGLAMASCAYGAQQDVSQISGIMSSVGALKAQTNSKLLAIDANFDELYAYRPWVKQTTAPADTTVLWFDTDQVEGYVVLKVHNGTTWVAHAMGTAGATAINDLTDVDTTGKATGKILKFDASGNLVVADDATGTGSVPSGSVNGQVLIWATDQWVASTAPWLTTAALGTGVETALGNAANGASGVVVLNASAQLPGVSGINLIGSWTGTTLTGITTFGPAIQKLGTEIDNMAQISTTTAGIVQVNSSNQVVVDANITAGTVTAAEYLVSGTGPFYSILPNNTGTLYTPGTGKTGFTVDDNVLKMFENGGSKYEVLNSNDLIGLSYPVSTSTTTATGNINIDGAAADHYYFNNGTSTATYTPVITSPPASGKERYVILTVGGGSGVITMTWTNVSWIGTAGAETTTASKYSHYGCIIPSSGNAKCKVIAEAADN